VRCALWFDDPPSVTFGDYPTSNGDLRGAQTALAAHHAAALNCRALRRRLWAPRMQAQTED